MKSRIGILKGKKIIIGEENELTKNEILLKPKGDKIELSVREGEATKVISGAESNDNTKGVLYVYDANYSNTIRREYNGVVFLDNELTSLNNTSSDYSLHKYSSISPKDITVSSNYNKNQYVNGINPFCALFYNSAGTTKYEISIFDKYDSIVKNIAKVYNIGIGNWNVGIPWFGSKEEVIFTLTPQEGGGTLFYCPEVVYNRDDALTIAVDADNNVLMLLGKYRPSNTITLKDTMDALTEELGGPFKIDYSNFKAI